ncbi:MAG: metallophosphoesterase [Sphingomonadaceae bacterium]
MRFARACLLLWSLMVALVLAPAAQANRIVAVGDLHGDFAAWRAIARDAGLVDARGRWTGGRTILVQMGDIADRGPDTLAIARDLMRLGREAARAGGRVHVLVGNHEAMNMTGDLRYVTPAEFAAFADAGSAARRERILAANEAAIVAAARARDPGRPVEEIRREWLAATPLGWVEHRLAWSPQGEIGRWVIANPAVLVIGDTLFVHAGLSAAHAARTPAEINAAVAAALAARDDGETAIINDPDGPLWYRGLVMERAAPAAPPPAAAAGAAPQGGPATAGDGPAAVPLTPAAELERVLAAQGVRRMVVGHTPSLSGIRLLHDGRLAVVDTGISASYGGRLSWLEIRDGVLVAHHPERPAPAAPR